MNSRVVISCEPYGAGLLEKLASIWDIGDGKRFYALALHFNLRDKSST